MVRLHERAVGAAIVRRLALIARSKKAAKRGQCSPRRPGCRRRGERAPSAQADRSRRRRPARARTTGSRGGDRRDRRGRGTGLPAIAALAPSAPARTERRTAPSRRNIRNAPTRGVFRLRHPRTRAAESKTGPARSCGARRAPHHQPTLDKERPVVMAQRSIPRPVRAENIPTDAAARRRQASVARKAAEERARAAEFVIEAIEVLYCSAALRASMSKTVRRMRKSSTDSAPKPSIGLGCWGCDDRASPDRQAVALGQR
jgi:hypothetical protein